MMFARTSFWLYNIFVEAEKGYRVLSLMRLNLLILLTAKKMRANLGPHDHDLYLVA